MHSNASHCANWGDRYPRLQQIKRKYDPENLFPGHQTVIPA
jgi:FAD/FMN-containing dehydrogenase